MLKIVSVALQFIDWTLNVYFVYKNYIYFTFMWLQYFYYSTYTGDIYQSLLIYFFFRLIKYQLFYILLNNLGICVIYIQFIVR